MAFAAKLTNPRQHAEALAINGFLKTAHGTSTTVPSRERSLQIFGDEKRLDTLTDTQGRLFGGRLTLADLQCSRIPLPLPYQSPDVPAAGRPMLILENHHSYWSFCTWNRQSRQYAAIAYGSGNAFGTSVEHLDLIAAESGAVGLHYLGGMSIYPASASHCVPIASAWMPVFRPWNPRASGTNGYCVTEGVNTIHVQSFRPTTWMSWPSGWGTGYGRISIASCSMTDVFRRKRSAWRY